jgi:hypothetical protein
MRERLTVVGLVLWSLAAAGCETPAQVKQLSLKQMEYFDFAIEAVSLQSEALILATEKLVSQAQQRIEATQNTNQERFAKFAAETLPSLPDDQKTKKAQEMLQNVADVAKETETARAQLDQDLTVIKSKSEELQAYLAKMKEVHQALDAYIQSEKAGEQVVRDMLHYPSVRALVASADDLIPKVHSGIETIQTLLSKK